MLITLLNAKLKEAWNKIKKKKLYSNLPIHRM